jgi:serine/threonine protein kinase
MVHAVTVEPLQKSEPESSSATLTLPPELLAEASRRLGWAALLYAGTYALAYFGPLIVVWATVPNPVFAHTQNLFAALSVGLGLAVFVLSRRAVMSPQALLDLGLVFEAVGSVGISIAEFWQGFPAVDFTAGKFIGIPWECIWIIIFPLIAPNTPRKVIVASLAAASTGPITLFVRRAMGAPVGLPTAILVTYFLFTTYLCVIVAYLIARIVYRYTVRLRKAREIGSYELLTKLGEGGMGEVWVARHRMLARPAAVKLIRSEALGSDPRTWETLVKRFEREAMATAALRSTHTIDVYDFGVTEEGAFFYVMEFLEGLNLDVMVRRFGPVEAGRTIYLLKQVCHSLGEAHARGMIHRDVKPANIFTSRLGPDCDFVKVLDFGLVKQTADTARMTDLTGIGVTAGTPAYMAPEVATGQQDVDGRADIYAVGCVAYWLLTGQPVFHADTPLATILAHVREAPLPPSQRTEIPIPAALEALILECLSKNPAGRPSTTGELADRLDAIPTPLWTPNDARRWWALHGPLGALSSIAGQDLSAAAVVYARRSTPTKQVSEEPTPTEPPQGSRLVRQR